MARRQIFLKDDVWSALHAEATASSRSVGNMLTLILAERYMLRVYGEPNRSTDNLTTTPTNTPRAVIRPTPLPTTYYTQPAAPPLPTYDTQCTTTAGAPTRRWMSADEVQKVVKCAWFLWPVAPGNPPADNTNVVITTDSEGVNWYVDVSEGRRWEYHT